jgi:hypothetical protein
MPVRKFRDVSEMEGNTWHDPGDPRLFEAIRSVWGLGGASTKARFPPGVYKHRSIEQANEQQQSWDQAIFDALRARRREGSTR